MVWCFFSVDARPGEDKYYIFSKGTIKVGRKGCDIVVNNDKGVSRVHMEIIVDAMISRSSFGTKSTNSSGVRIRDCSKYGTFINKGLGSQKKVHEFPNRETTLKDGDSVSFGTGNSTFRFSFVPLLFCVLCSESSQVSGSLQDKVSSIGASTIDHLNQDCTHILVDQVIEVTEGLLDAVVEKKPLVTLSWLESLAEKNIRNEIPSCNTHVPTLTVDGSSVKVADPKTRESCLHGYTFLLEPIYMYKFGDKLQMLLTLGGAKNLSVDEFHSNSQGSDLTNSNHIVYVAPGQSASSRSSKLSLYKVEEMDLIYAVLCGHLNPSSLKAPPVLVSSSCSTDETTVADSDMEEDASKPIRADGSTTEEDSCQIIHETADIAEDETYKPLHEAVINYKEEQITISETKEGVDFMSVNRSSLNYKDEHSRIKKDKDEGSEQGTSDVIYSQQIVVKLPTRPRGAAEVDFKRFKKGHTQSGNSFNNLVPFSKLPYGESLESGREDVDEALREEKRRKKMEALAEDLFNNQEGRKRAGAAGSIRGFLSRG